MATLCRLFPLLVLALALLATVPQAQAQDTVRTVNRVVLVSSARTATATSDAQPNVRGRRLAVYLDVSVITDAGASLTPSLQYKDPVSLNWVTVWTGAAKVPGAAATYTYYFADGASGGSWTEVGAFGLNTTNWRIKVTHADAKSITYSVGAAVEE